MIRTSSASLVFLLLFTAGLLAGCAQPQVPEEKFYRLMASAPAEKMSSPLLKGSLMVDQFPGNGLTSERPLLYAEGGENLTVQQYHYHSWIDAPPRMIQEQAVSYLRAGGLADVIFTQDMRLPADYVLGGRIKRLERMGSGSSSKAVIEMELSLIHIRDDSLIVMENFVAEEAAGESMASVVEAANRALSGILEKFVARLKEKKAGR